MHAGVNSPSYQQASSDLAALGDLTVAPKPIERLVKRIGRERIDGRDAAVAAHQRLPLIEKDGVADPRRPCPAVAMVSVDGGRLQLRSTPTPTPTPTPTSTPTSHWRESKAAVLETYLGEVHPTDPDPDVPRCFLDLKRTMKVVRGLGHALPTGLEFEGDDPPPRARGRPEAVVTAPSGPAAPGGWFAASWRVEPAVRTSAR